MTTDELNQSIAWGESKTLELKKSTGQRTAAAKTACAMLNGKGVNRGQAGQSSGELHVGEWLPRRGVEHG